MQRLGGQKKFNMILMVSALVIIVIITAYAFTKQTSVELPNYLNRCIPLTGPYVYRSIPAVAINISGVPQQIPANIGINGNCFRPIFTLANTGAIHIVTDVDRNYTLGDFFLVWGNTYGVSYATFNQFQIFDHKTDQNHNLTMIVYHSGQGAVPAPSNSFQNYVFPRNANSTDPYLIQIVYS